MFLQQPTSLRLVPKLDRDRRLSKKCQVFLDVGNRTAADHYLGHTQWQSSESYRYRRQRQAVLVGQLYTTQLVHQ